MFIPDDIFLWVFPTIAENIKINITDLLPALWINSPPKLLTPKLSEKLHKVMLNSCKCNLFLRLQETIERANTALIYKWAGDSAQCHLASSHQDLGETYSRSSSLFRLNQTHAFPLSSTESMERQL